MCKGNKPTPNNNNDFDPHDDRPFVKDLLREHAASIEDVRGKIRSDESVRALPEAHRERYDDGLWIVRFLLSNHGRVKDATRAAIKTIKFREEQHLNEIGDIRHMLMNYGVSVVEDDDENNNNNNTLVNDNTTITATTTTTTTTVAKNKNDFFPYYHEYNSCFGKDCVTVTQPDPDRGIMVYMDAGGIDANRLADTLTRKQQTEYRIIANEATYQVLDDVTRRTGRLTKLTQIMDETNVSILKVNRKSIQQDAEISKELEDYYPQLLASIYIFNAPRWVHAIWKVLRPLFPKRLVEKVDFMPPNATKKGIVYEPLRKHVSEANLPERYGGTNPNWPLPSVSEQLRAAAAGGAS